MIVYTVGDTKPDLDFECVKNGAYLPAPPATATFKLKKPSGNTVTVVLSLIDAATARYAGNFGLGDLDEPGMCYGELIVGSQHAEEPFEIYVRPEFVEARR